MSLPLRIARKYLLSRRKRNFINIISILAIVGVSFSTAALVIVLSVFNGLEDLLHRLNNAFDPEIKVVPLTGKSFVVTDSMITTLHGVKGVETVTQVIEDYAYVRYRDANQVVTMKGVSDDFLQQHNIDHYIVAGKLALWEGEQPRAIIGRGVQYFLSVAVGDPLYSMQVYYIKDARATLDPSQLYARKNIVPAGVFSIIQDYDEDYIIVPLKFAQDLLNYGRRRTALEIKTVRGTNVPALKAKLKSILGPTLMVLDHEEQHKDLYRLLRVEKLFSFIAFTLLLGIGSISIFFSLTMLVLEKKKDISVLSSLGATPRLIRNIFLTEGALIAALGAASGLVIGVALCAAQSRYGLISMGMETSVTEGYPVKVIPSDLVSIAAVVTLLTFLISYRPAWLASRSSSVEHL